VVKFPVRARGFVLLQGVQIGSGARLALYVKGTWLLSRGIKWTLGEVDRSFSTSGVAKNACSYECISASSPYAILSCTGTILLYRLK